MTATPGFTGSRLDRADALRGDEAALAALQARPNALILPLDALDPRLDEAGRLLWTPLKEWLETQANPAHSELVEGCIPAAQSTLRQVQGERGYDSPNAPPPLAFLGLLDDAPRYVALADAPHAARRSAGIMGTLDRMPPEEASTYAAARSLVDWHARHRFCANCGAGTTPFRAGWARLCGGCGTEHYPRTDPVVIMLAEHGSGDDLRVLVGRQASWPAGRYSALAGFVEVGESLEEAVARELHEEAGVRAGAVRFVASQPWPFPSQLMIACIAEVADDSLRLDAAELEAAMWVTREQVRAALAEDPAAPFLAPPPYAIAHTLLARWSVEGNARPGASHV